ncbi:MAG: glycosyltransferase family 2 protein [Algoriphagus sp.]|uniref:glycosyltransferase family 2 protein n=1 Tax=Algoriphagus sp. TaxID=1872435 RepID=UPI0018215094|nr:glycosyltransferase family 2 protein [Algoriphagus sp.]NVJ85987.1 glycosyltransferase family 2 protein [Algoriphagus sp.]
MKINFSVLILTYNEEINIERCLQPLSELDDIIVVDSFSTDKTIPLLNSYSNVRVFQRKFDDFASQRNFGLKNFGLKHPWVLHLDADEVVDKDFLEECSRLAELDEKSGYLVPSKLIFLNKWIKHASGFPVYQMRFMKIGEVEFVQVGHGQREGNSKRGIGYMNTPYLHYNFSKGLADWFEKHNRYSTQEAQQEQKNEKDSLRHIFSSNKILRRRALKKISHRIPFRPFFKFCYLYFFKMGFLDGKAGFYYCQLMWLYESMIVVKKKENF